MSKNTTEIDKGTIEHYEVDKGANDQALQQEPDQYDLKIREIEEKIKKRKEEQEAKRKKNQLFNELMSQ